jgi:Family of unknown function (DUF5719)
MRPAPLLAALALAAAATAAQLTGSTAPAPPAPRTVTAPVTDTTLVCPNISGSAPGGPTVTTGVVADVASALTPPSTSTGSVTRTFLKGAASRPAAARLAPGITLSSGPTTTGPLAVRATGSVAATVVADQVTLTTAGRFRALSSARCSSPSADWWFAGADGRVGYTDQLFLANPSDTGAQATVSVWSAKGQLTPPRLASLPVAAHSSLVVSIPSVAPDAATLALHVHATSGAITAALLDTRVNGVKPAGTDWMPATLPPGRTAVVAGFPTGAGARSLVLADPGGVDATVGIKIIGTSGSFAPSGVNQVVVHAGHTQIVDLTKPLGAATGAVMVTSDQPVVAQGLAISTSSGGLPDLQWQAATPALTGPAAFADGREPDGGPTTLLLSAPAGAASVRIATLHGVSKIVDIAAGHSTSTVLATLGRVAATSGVTVTPVGSAPVYVTRQLSFAGAHGPLTTSEPVLALPTPLPLPVVIEDQRAAIRPAG